MADTSPAKCQAIVDDWQHGGYHAPAQRIHAPGQKPCSRNAVEQAGHLHLCAAHAKLARQGFVAKDGRVTDRNTRADYRRYPKTFTSPRENWLPGASPFND